MYNELAVIWKITKISRHILRDRNGLLCHSQSVKSDSEYQILLEAKDLKGQRYVRACQTVPHPLPITCHL